MSGILLWWLIFTLSSHKLCRLITTYCLEEQAENPKGYEHIVQNLNLMQNTVEAT
jgi:hypothetical protein